MNYQEILNQGSKILKLNNIKSYNLDSEVLLSSTLKLNRSQLILNLDKKIENKEKKNFFNLIERRKKNEPIAYIVGYKEFWKSIFKVDRNVLIPRPDTETIIEQVLNELDIHSSKKNSIIIQKCTNIYSLTLNEKIYKIILKKKGFR